MGGRILGAALGLVTGGVGIAFAEAAGFLLHPPPVPLQEMAAWAADAENVRAHAAGAPAAALLAVLLAHFLGSFLGALVATLVSGRVSPAPALAVGLLLLSLGLFNAVAVPHPLWFRLLDPPLAYLPAAWLGWRLLRRGEARA